MKKFLAITIILLILIGAGAFFAGSYTVVQTEEELVFLEKESFQYENVYLDVRDWTVNDYAEHPNILKGLINKGYSDLRKHLENSEIKQKLEQLGKEFNSLLDSFSSEEK